MALSEDAPNRPVVEIVGPELLCEVLAGLATASGRQEGLSTARFTTWRREGPWSFACPSADLHLVLIDGGEWMGPALARAVIGQAGRWDSNDCPVCDLLVVSFRPEPQALSEADRGRVWRGFNLFNQAFPHGHRQLPLSLMGLGELVERVTDLPRKEKMARSKVWQACHRRVRFALSRFADVSDEDSWWSAWDRWEAMAASPDLRLAEEHDVRDEATLLRFQRLVDHYYLAAARSNGGRRQYLVIEDNLGPCEGGKPGSPLARAYRDLARSTGATFWVTADAEACGRLASASSGREFQDALAGQCVRIDRRGITPNQSPEIRTIDAALVDLLLRRPDGTSGADGEDITAALSNLCPELPVMVVTRSEEPDVLARCVKTRGADRVVPKRRILRLPYVLESYLHEQVSPLLAELPAPLDRELVRLYRTWTHEPGILWHGEKTYQAAEHGIVHHTNLWRLANELLARTWPQVHDAWVVHRPEDEQRTAEEALFCFLLAIWLHDVGCRGDGDHQMADEVRGRHAWLSGKLIRRHGDAFGLDCLDEKTEKYVEDVALLAEYHQSNCPLTREDLKRINEDEQEATHHLFSSAMVDVAPALMSWEALLRLLDALEHDWRRVDGPVLHASKNASMDDERQYYLRLGRLGRLDAGEYARWLAEQPRHLDKHLAVREVKIHVERDRGLWALYPCYRLAETDSDGGHAAQTAALLAEYVLKEWFASGKYLRELGLCMSAHPPTAMPAHLHGRGFRPVWAPDFAEKRQGPKSGCQAARRGGRTQTERGKGEVPRRVGRRPEHPVDAGAREGRRWHTPRNPPLSACVVNAGG